MCLYGIIMDRQYIRPFQPFTKKNLLIFLVPVCFYSGFVLGNRGVFILGEILLCVLIMAHLYSRQLLRTVEIQRHHHPRTFEKSDLLIGLHFKTDDLVPHYLLEAVDTTPPADRFQVGSLIPGSFDSRDEYFFEYRLYCSRRRGVYTLGPIRLNCADPLGLFSREVKLPVFSSLMLYPVAYPLQAFRVLGDGVLRQVGIETILTSGHSEEFIGVREYVRGDPPRRVHWKLSAHHRRLIVKEFKQNTTTEVTIFLDAFRLSMSGIGDVTSIEYSIKAAAAIARTAIDKSHKVEFFAFSGKHIHVPTGGGFQHLLTILDQLTFITAGGEGDFGEEVEKYLKHIPRGSTAVFIICLSTLNVERFKPVLRQCAIMRVRPIVVVIDDKTFLKLWRGQDKRHAEAMSIAEMIVTLQQQGCDVYAIANKEEVHQKLVTRSEL
jgi:uncharacterized protein (DUF58 family)